MPPKQPAPFFWTRIFLTAGLLLSIVGLWFLAESKSALNNLDSRTLPGLEIAGEIKQGPPQLHMRVLEYLASDSASGPELTHIREDYHRKLAELTDHIGKYRFTIAVDEDRRLVDEFETRAREFDSLAGRILSGPTDVPLADLRRLDESFRRFDDASDRLFDFKWKRASMWVDVSVKNAERAVLITTFILGVLFTLSLLIFIRVVTLRLTPQSPANF